MTLPRFLDCAFTLLFDEYQRLGQDMVTTMEKLQDWQPGKPRPAGKKEAPVSTAAKNTQALTDLQTMLAGVKR